MDLCTKKQLIVNTEFNQLFFKYKTSEDFKQYKNYNLQNFDLGISQTFLHENV